MESKYQRGEKALKADVESLQKVKKVLIDEKKHIRFGEWNAFDIEVFFFYFKYFAVLWIRIVPDPNFLQYLDSPSVLFRKLSLKRSMKIIPAKH